MRLNQGWPRANLEFPYLHSSYLLFDRCAFVLLNRRRMNPPPRSKAIFRSDLTGIKEGSSREECAMASGNGTAGWHEETVRVDDTDLIVAKGGTGKPVLILHEELGWPGWLKWNSALGQKYNLLIPQHPGFSHTPRAEWIGNIRDLAGFYARYLFEQNLTPIDVIGFSMGGWIAAEMAACNPNQFRKLVMVAPMGIRPREGAILDFFQLMAPKHLFATVHDPDATPEFDQLYGGQGPEQFERWEEARAQSARLAWVPFMHNPSLPHLLAVA